MKLTDIQISGDFQEDVVGLTVGFPCTIHSASLDHFRNGSVAWHWHDEAELLLVREGQVEIEVPHRSVQLEPGDGAFFAPGQLHAYRPRSAGAFTDACLFDPVLLAGYRNSYFDRAFLSPIHSGAELHGCVFSHDQEKHRVILQKLNEIVKEEETAALGWEMEIAACLSQIWVQMLRLVGLEQLPKHTAGDLNDQRAKDMLLFIQQHYGEKLEMERIAAAAHIGVREGFRVFRSTLGMSPVQYVTNYRLYQAAEQLTRGDASVTEISENCGFSTPSYFARVFREKMGCTPREYRMNFRKKVDGKGR